MKLLNKGFISFNPLGSHRGSLRSAGANWLPYELGREYYLSVNAYKFDNEQSPIIKAQLKLIQLEDKSESGHAEKRSGCFSIELISYEYSDIYRLLDEIVDDEDGD
jgi:hypothetical protein